MTIHTAKQIQEQIDAAIKLVQGTPRHPGYTRRHLGASTIGGDCDREIWYSFRWATNVQFDGRVLRLFDRGHEEEFRFIEFLNVIGVDVEAYDPATFHELWYHPETDEYVACKVGAATPYMLQACTNVTDIPWRVEHAKHYGVELPAPQQHGFRAIMGHYGGSLDGIATGVPGVELFGLSRDTRILIEFKTHSHKSFTDMYAFGVAKSKPVHLEQMCQYMEVKNLPLALYCAVNKNDDNLYFEFVLPDRGRALHSMSRAQQLVHAKIPPPRISEHATWYRCKFCDHRPTCHFGAPMQRSCRTCCNSTPVENGLWHCSKWDKIIPKEGEKRGCGHYEQIGA